MINQQKNHYWKANSVLALALATVGLSFGMSADNAIGETAEEIVRIEANIPKMCQFDEYFGQVDIVELMDGKPDSASPAEATARVTCNAIADVELESTHGGMRHFGVHITEAPPLQETPLGDPYLTQFDYTATLADGNGQEVAQLDTANASGTITEQSAFGGVMPTGQDLTLEIRPQNVAGVLQAGRYRDELVVRIIPQE